MKRDKRTGRQERHIIQRLLKIKGLPRWDDRFGQYGIKVSFSGSGTLKIVILVENHPQKRIFRLDYYHPSEGRGVN